MNPSYLLVDPAAPILPLVVDSPHSGLRHTEPLPLAAEPSALLTGWDAYVDELFAHTPEVGGALLSAAFPRWLVDANRARDDIDPELVDGELPYPIHPSDKARRGMGVLRRFALPGVPVYNGKLSPELVERLLATYYDPYHAALAGLIEARHARFGAVWHIDCHSMKSRGNAMNIDNGAIRPDFVIGNRDGKSCSADFVAVVVDALRGLGYEVGVNAPYKGAQLVAAYSDPARGRHSLQLEINRALYLDEARFAKHEGFATLQAHLSQVLAQVAGFIKDRVAHA